MQASAESSGDVRGGGGVKGGGRMGSVEGRFSRAVGAEGEGGECWEWGGSGDARR